MGIHFVSMYIFFAICDLLIAYFAQSLTQEITMSMLKKTLNHVP